MGNCVSDKDYFLSFHGIVGIFSPDSRAARCGVTELVGVKQDLRDYGALTLCTAPKGINSKG
jgi:hypothetical protein